jgi:predicted deacylase
VTHTVTTPKYDPDTDGLQTPGTEHLEGREWGLAQIKKYSYEEDVLSRLKLLQKERWDLFQVEKYGEVTYGTDHDPYDLMRVKVGDWKEGKPTIVIVGGTHGYERGGVLSALDFLENEAEKYAEDYNVVVYPCLSPAAYEICSRWNLDKQDPNRGFMSDSDVPESRQFIESLKEFGNSELVIDLHETPVSDRIIMKQQGASGGTDPSNHPDGFYLLEICSQKENRLGPEIVKAVEDVTSVCRFDTIIGLKAEDGVIYDLGPRPTTHPGLYSTMMAFLVDSGFTNHAITTECLTENLSMRKRVAAQIAVLEVALQKSLKRFQSQ